jgi:hypothetical protein
VALRLAASIVRLRRGGIVTVRVEPGVKTPSAAQIAAPHAHANAVGDHLGATTVSTSAGVPAGTTLVVEVGVT